MEHSTGPERAASLPVVVAGSAADPGGPTADAVLRASGDCCLAASDDSCPVRWADSSPDCLDALPARCCSPGQPGGSHPERWGGCSGNSAGLLDRCHPAAEP